MATRQRKIRKTGRLLLPILAIAVISYFGYHSIHGDRGLDARKRFQQKAAELELRLAGLVEERERLQEKVMLLPSHGPVVKDMLDEQAREALNLTRPNEIVIFDDQGS